MRRSGLYCAIGFLSAATAGQAAPEGAAQNESQTQAQVLADVCTKVVCRKTVRTLALRTNDGKVAQIDTQLFPYLDQQGRLSIYPGETITLGFEKNGDGPPRLLKVTDPGGDVDLGPVTPSDFAVVFTLRQRDEKPDMWLTIANTVMATFKYDVDMFVPTPSGLRPSHTSTCPLLSPQGTLKSFSGVEMWPQPIVMLVI